MTNWEKKSSEEKDKAFDEIFKEIDPKLMIQLDVLLDEYHKNITGLKEK